MAAEAAVLAKSRTDTKQGQWTRDWSWRRVRDQSNLNHSTRTTCTRKGPCTNQARRYEAKLLQCGVLERCKSIEFRARHIISINRKISKLTTHGKGNPIRG